MFDMFERCQLYLCDLFTMHVHGFNIFHLVTLFYIE